MRVGDKVDPWYSSVSPCRELAEYMTDLEGRAEDYNSGQTTSSHSTHGGYVRAGHGDVLYFEIFDGDRMLQFVDCGAGNGLLLIYLCKLRRERNKGHLEAHAVEMDTERCGFMQGMVDSGDRALQSVRIHNLDWTDSSGGGDWSWLSKRKTVVFCNNKQFRGMTQHRLEEILLEKSNWDVTVVMYKRGFLCFRDKVIEEVIDCELPRGHFSWLGDIEYKELIKWTIYKYRKRGGGTRKDNGECSPKRGCAKRTCSNNVNYKL